MRTPPGVPEGQGKARRDARAAASWAGDAGVAAARDSKVCGGGREEEAEDEDDGSPWWRSPMAVASRAASRLSKRGGVGTSSRWEAAVAAARAGVRAA